MRCLKRHLGRCAAYAVIGSIAFVPFSLGARDGNLPDDFALPSVVTDTSTATGSLTVQQYNPDTMLDREVSAPGPGYHSMQAAVPADVRPVPAPEDEKPT